MPQDACTERSLLLALYTDVTVSYASRDAAQMAPPEARCSELYTHQFVNCI